MRAQPRRTRTTLCLAGLALTVLAIPAAAQDKLAEGTWIGSVIPPGEGPTDLEYAVSYGDDGLEILLIALDENGEEELEAYEVLYEGDVLSFRLEVGISVSCALYREDDGRFEGECADPSGESAFMTMSPPDGSGTHRGVAANVG